MGRFGSPEALAWLGAHGTADSVELKTLLVPPADPVAEALTGRRGPMWSERRTYLIDTAGLDLVRAGVEIRLRRRARGRYDLVVAARHGIDRRRPASRGVRVEVDLVPGAVWQDVEIRREVEGAHADRAIAGACDSAVLLSAAQRSWACRGGTLTVDDARLAQLCVHGPALVRRVKVTATRLGLHRADLEHFRLPSGRELVELSTHCRPREVTETAAAFERLLDEGRVGVMPGYRSRISEWRDEIGA